MLKPKRIMIFGRPGSGKSTFAVALSKYLNLPLYHLDKYFFTSSWVERPYEEFLQIQHNIIHQDQWIIDGNSVRSLEMRFARANLVIYFDIPRLCCFLRLIKRRFFKDTSIDDRAPNCPEILRFRLITYMWRFHTRVAPFLDLIHENSCKKTVIHIKNDHDIQKLLKDIL